MPKSAKVYEYDTIQLPLIGSLNNRAAAATKDQIFYNGVFDTYKNPIDGKPMGVAFQKRGAFIANTTIFASGGAGRGLYFWTKTGKYYAVIATKLYSVTTGGTVTELKTLATATGKVWFEETTGSSNLLFIADGTDIYTMTTSDVVTEVADGDQPAGALTPVALDGYVFVAKSGTDEIFNSDVDDPTAWDPASFLSCEMYPDHLVALAKQANYVVAFGTYSTEFFYNNANASGSPLRRTDSVAAKIGLAARDSVAQIDKRLIFIGQTKTGDPGVWVFNGLTAQLASDEYVDRILANEGSALANATGWITRHKGHTLYMIGLTSRTLAYDMDATMWIGDWSITNAGAHAVLPFKYMTEGVNNQTMVLHNTDGKMYKLDPALFEDTAGSILCWITTMRYDMGSARWTRCIRVELVADKQSAGTVTLEYSDDDYQTWSTARTLTLIIRPFTKALGVFRRRAFRIKHTANADFRVEKLEMDYNEGVS